MEKFRDLSFGKKILHLGTLAGSLMAILTFLIYLYNHYDEYSEEEKLKKELQLDKKIESISKTVIEKETTTKIYKINNLLDSLESVIDKMQEGSEYFAIGLRGDGTGNKWYRDEFGHLHKAFYDRDYNLHYYLNNSGAFIYVY